MLSTNQHNNSQDKNKQHTVLYQDRRFEITSADIKTPSTYYPTADTVGRVRYDVLYGACAYTALMGAAFTVYGDLLYLHELLMAGGSVLLALFLGLNISILQLDARGFPPRLFLARTKTVRAIFTAITRARAGQHSNALLALYGGENDAESQS